MHAIFNKDQFT